MLTLALTALILAAAAALLALPLLRRGGSLPSGCAPAADPSGEGCAACPRRDTRRCRASVKA